MPEVFPLSARVNGRDLLFLGVDVVTGVFFDGFPDDMPLTNCWQKGDVVERIAKERQQEAWHDAILTRAVTVLTDAGWQLLTPELVQRLGAGRDDLVTSYFSAIGWIRPGEKGYRDCDLPMPETVAFAPSVQSRFTQLTRIPGHNMLWVLKEMAMKSATGVRDIWKSWPISDFVWTWRVALEPELTKAKEEKRLGGLTPEMAAVGTS